jgi:hypothetical protein
LSKVDLREALHVLHKDDEIIVARRPYSANPADSYLEVVLAYRGYELNMPWVTWVNNKQSGGYGEGHYFSDIVKAAKDFEVRGTKKQQEAVKTALLQEQVERAADLLEAVRNGNDDSVWPEVDEFIEEVREG